MNLNLWRDDHIDADLYDRTMDECPNDPCYLCDGYTDCRYSDQLRHIEQGRCCETEGRGDRH